MLIVRMGIIRDSHRGHNDLADDDPARVIVLMAILRVMPAAIFVIGEILEFWREGSTQARFDRGKVNRPGLWLRVLMRFLDKPIGYVMRLFRLLRFWAHAPRAGRA